MFDEIESSACGIMILCQLDDQIESPADFSHFDPICLALAPPTSPAPDREGTDGRTQKRSSVRPSQQQQQQERTGGGEAVRRRRGVGTAGTFVVVGRGDLPPLARRSQSLNRSSSFSACLPARA